VEKRVALSSPFSSCRPSRGIPDARIREEVAFEALSRVSSATGVALRAFNKLKRTDGRGETFSATKREPWAAEG
jgi:hypothetical protein